MFNPLEEGRTAQGFSTKEKHVSNKKCGESQLLILAISHWDEPIVHRIFEKAVLHTGNVQILGTLSFPRINGVLGKKGIFKLFVHNYSKQML